MENLIIRLRRSGLLLLIGSFLIGYVAVGILYFQQGQRQRDLQTQIAKQNLVVSRPLPSEEKLQAAYKVVNKALSPLADAKVLEVLVDIAQKSGIDVEPGGGKLTIPPPDKPKEQKVGEGKYQVLSINNIRAQGDQSSVMAFVSDLDYGKTLKTMVLKSVDISQAEGRGGGKGEALPELVAVVSVDIYTKPIPVPQTKPAPVKK